MAGTLYPMSLGPQAVLDTNGNITGIYGPGGAVSQVAQSYTWAQIQALVSPTIGQRVIATDLNYATFIWNGTVWESPNPIVLQPSGGLSFVLPSSGTMANNGAVTLTTALPYTYSACWMYFPANAIQAGSTAAWYYTVMSSTTVGTVFQQNVSGTFATSTGSSLAPTSPTAWVSTGPGAFTQTTGEIPAITWALPSNLLTPTAEFCISYRLNCPSNANGRKSAFYAAGGDQTVNNTFISALGGMYQYLFNNAGSYLTQVTQGNNYGGFGTTTSFAVGRGNVANFSTAQNISLTLTSPVATDWLVIETYKAAITHGF
jgi:hypothetical protein